MWVYQYESNKYRRNSYSIFYNYLFSIIYLLINLVLFIYWFIFIYLFIILVFRFLLMHHDLWFMTFQVHFNNSDSLRASFIWSKMHKNKI